MTRVAIRGLPEDLESLVSSLFSTVPWDGEGVPDDAVALVVDVRAGVPADPGSVLPAVVVHAGGPPPWASFSVPAPEAAATLGAAVVAAATEGAVRRALAAERSLVADLVDLVCHDARNPLAAIQANLGLLESAAADPDWVESVADARMAAETALRVVDNLALAASAEGGRPRRGRGTVDARAALAAAIRRATRAAEISGIPIAADLPASAVPCGCAPEILDSLLDNLFAAALRHAPRGTEVAAGLGRVGSSVRVTISEAGPAATEDVRARLFDRAFQPLSKKLAGSRYARGLGLYVAGVLAKSCGARLEAAHERGRHTYRLDLPPAGGDQ